MGEDINKGGEANQVVDNNVEEEPEQHLEMAEEHPFVRGVDVAAGEQLPIDADVCDAYANEVKDHS